MPMFIVVYKIVNICEDPIGSLIFGSWEHIDDIFAFLKRQIFFLFYTLN